MSFARREGRSWGARRTAIAAMPMDIPPTMAPSLRLQLLLATACGLCVANMYYAQPILGIMARDLSVSRISTALVVTVSQVGYAVGLLFLVSLGDIVERRRLVTWILPVAALAAAGAALAPTITILEVAIAVLALCSVVAQILVPFAADLSGEAVRGRVVGLVMTGLLLGILLSRTISGAVTQIAGWRAVYWMTAAIMTLLLVVLRSVLPASEPTKSLSYPRLLASVGKIFATEPQLRRRAAYGALTFAAFSIFWTTASFELSGPPFYYSSGVIGLFGLAGAAGVLGASAAGRLADRRRTVSATGAFLAAVTLAFGLLSIGRYELISMVAGAVVLDLGVQGTHISNQSVIYALRAGARSRINTAYMTCYFAGGALGSAAADIAWSAAGWTGVCLIGSLTGMAGFALWLHERPPRWMAWHRMAGVAGKRAGRVS
jgi:predicted MFS family arabinose efflux permease